MNLIIKTKVKKKMKTIKLVRRLLFLLLVFGMSTGVYGQERAKKLPLKTGRFLQEDLLLPKNDTVIMQGAEIKVGAYLYKKWYRSVEIVGFGKSKESDFEKGFYFIQQKPKRTITYQLVVQEVHNNRKTMFTRTVYVAKTEEEKMQLEKQLKEKREAEKKRMEEQGRTGQIDFSGLKQFEPKKK